jgi:PEP-CTERM motif
MQSIGRYAKWSWQVALVAFCLFCVTIAHADPITFAYQGKGYTIVGSSFPGLSAFDFFGADRMTGTATINFAGAGTYQASSWSLTSTTTGNVAPTPGSIVAWDLGASASLNGNPQLDRLETTTTGDQALDWTQLGFNLRSTASSVAPGTWSAVPEPGSITLFATGIAMVGLAARRKRRKWL